MVGGAPAPLVGSRAEAGSDRVLEEVFAGCFEVVVVLDQVGGEAVAEEVAAAGVAAVEALRVDPVQSLETGGEAGAGGAEDEVVVRAP